MCKFPKTTVITWIRLYDKQNPKLVYHTFHSSVFCVDGVFIHINHVSNNGIVVVCQINEMKRELKYSIQKPFSSKEWFQDRTKTTFIFLHFCFILFFLLLNFFLSFVHSLFLYLFCFMLFFFFVYCLPNVLYFDVAFDSNAFSMDQHFRSKSKFHF